MRIEVASDRVVEQFARRLASLSAGRGRQVQVRAINRVATTVHGRVISAVARQSSIPRAIVRGAVGRRLAATRGDGPIEALVYASGGPIPLREFGPRQLSYGVRVKLFGRMQRLRGMFIYAGHHRSGKYVGAGHVFQRFTSRSLPIAMQDGPSVPEQLVRGESVREFERTVAEMLPRRIARELDRLLP